MQMTPRAASSLAYAVLAGEPIDANALTSVATAMASAFAAASSSDAPEPS
jgi:hypothetical protein